MVDPDTSIPEVVAEEWRPVVGSEGRFSVSSLGRVRSEPHVTIRKDGRTRRVWGQIMASCPNRHRRNYVFLILKDNAGRVGSRFVHRLVAEAFIRPLASGEEVDHIDFDVSNNQLANLRIVSHHANVAHTVSANRHTFGEKAPWAKLTESDVRSIFIMAAAGASQSTIGQRFGITQAQVWRILHGLRWRRTVKSLRAAG